MSVHAVRARRLAIVVGGGLLAATLLPTTPASAHSELVSMSPADGSTAVVAPTEIVLTFDENIQDIGDAVVVTGPDRKRVDDGPPSILDATVTEKLHPLVLRGHYTVSYRVVSADGHPVTRTLGFELAVGNEPTSGPGASPASPAAPTSGWPGWASALAATVALVAVGLVGVRLRLGRRAR